MMRGPYPEWFDKPQAPQSVGPLVPVVWARVASGASVRDALAEVCEPLTWPQIAELKRLVGVR